MCIVLVCSGDDTVLRVYDGNGNMKARIDNAQLENYGSSFNYHRDYFATGSFASDTKIYSISRVSSTQEYQKFTKIMNKFLTRLYDAEFECTDSVSVELPPPMYLALMNSSQMFQSANDHVENITPLYIDPNDQDQELVAKVKANIKKFYIKSFIPDATIQQIVDNTIMEHKRDQNPQQ